MFWTKSRKQTNRFRALGYDGVINLTKNAYQKNNLCVDLDLTRSL
jgi:hypothetical protein